MQSREFQKFVAIEGEKLAARLIKKASNRSSEASDA